MQAYTDEYLLEKLKELWDKYGKIQAKLIDKEPNFPTRKCYIRAFGSLENACKLIGYNEYKKHKFTMIDAQKVLDERNGHFKLLTFNGMANKCVIQCKECGTVDEIVPDSLLRNKTDEYFGCKVCNQKQRQHVLAIQAIQEKPVQQTLKEIRKYYPRKNNYGYVYEVFNLINNKKYIGSTIDPYNRWKNHIWAAFVENDPSYNYPLQAAIRKYGIENFVFHIICYNVPIANLAHEEQKMIIKHRTLANNGWGYNQTLETECALRDQNIKYKGNFCALIDDDNNILMTFNSYHDAARVLFNNDNAATKICEVCHGRRNTYRGMKFRDIERSD